MIPGFMTEVDEIAVRDCGGSSGLMGVNKASLGRYPTTRAEREALLRAAGTTESHEGVSVYTLRHGILRRYNHDVTLVETSASRFLDLMTPTMGAAVFGYYSELPAHFQRWDPRFAAKGDASYHVVYAQDHDASQRRVRLLDPLVPRGTSYQGEWCPDAALIAFATGYGSPVRALLFREGEWTTGTGNTTQQESEVRYIKTEGYRGKLLNVGDHHPWFTLDGQAAGEIASATALNVIGLVDGKAGQYAVEIGSADSDVSPSGKSQHVVVMVKSTNDAYDRPVSSGATAFTQAQVDAKVVAERDRVKREAIARIEGLE